MKKLRYLIVVILVILDQASKYLIRTNMSVGESIDVLGNIFSITFVRNFGAAFSSLTSAPIFLKVFPIVLVIVAIFILEKFIKSHWTLITALVLIISGGIGNLIDRWVFGYVTDMFDFHFWPVFNVADICVTCGCVFLVLYVIFFDKNDGKE